MFPSLHGVVSQGGTVTVILTTDRATSVGGANATVQTRNYGGTNILLVSSTGKMLVFFDMTAIPTAKTAVTATLTITHANATSAGAGTMLVYPIGALNDGWPEGDKNQSTGVAGDCCWNYFEQTPGSETAWAGSAGLSTAGTDYEATALSDAVAYNRADAIGTKYTFTFNAGGLTRLSQMFGPSGTNYGFLIIPTIGAALMASDTNDTPGYPPTLTITYS